MRALTCTQPWAGLVASGIKLVENMPRKMIKRSDFGVPFAIHASREIDEAVYDRIHAIAPEIGRGDVHESFAPPWGKLSRIKSAVIGVCTIAHELSGGWDERTIRENREALAQQFMILTGRDDQARWFFGSVGYVLCDVVALPTPVPARGYQGFWTLDVITEAAVRAQLKHAIDEAACDGLHEDHAPVNMLCTRCFPNGAGRDRSRGKDG
jgi:hypothetical protein